ncbi:MAG: hypothetical protein HYZ49_05855 [Chloroflexi bacterium]|nr:hypothetical protein [Chloroflexota bacterium]
MPIVIGFLGPWVSPQSPTFYTENLGWMDGSLVALFRPLLEALGCVTGCNFSTLISASPWSAVAAALARGESLFAWQFLIGTFPVTLWLWSLALSYPLAVLLVLVRIVIHRHSFARLLDAFLAGVSGVSLLLSIFQFHALDTLGYSSDFVLCLIATLAGSHQGWGIMLGFLGHSTLATIAIIGLVRGGLSRQSGIEALDEI